MPMIFTSFSTYSDLGVLNKYLNYNAFFLPITSIEMDYYLKLKIFLALIIKMWEKTVLSTLEINNNKFISKRYKIVSLKRSVLGQFSFLQESQL